MAMIEIGVGVRIRVGVRMEVVVISLLFEYSLVVFEVGVILLGIYIESIICSVTVAAQLLFLKTK